MSQRYTPSSDARLNRVTQLLLVALIIGGVVARVHDFGYPNELTWDEHHFVENARNLLEGRSDRNDHPPLESSCSRSALSRWATKAQAGAWLRCSSGWH